MRKIILIALATSFLSNIWAQSVNQELKTDFNKAGSNYYIYPVPTKPLTPAPHGKKPFYISHYGRHGSRYLINQREYDYPYATLKEADRAGKLSDRGKLVLQHVAQLRDEAKGRLGDLTSIGAEQHCGIAERMFRNYPEVFKGDACVEAKSTVVTRCIISMDNALRTLAALNPKLRITSDASEHDMYYMNLQDRKLYHQKWPAKATALYEDYCTRHSIHEKAMLRLFNDSVYAREDINLYRLNLQMMKLASSVQGTKLGRQFSLFDEVYTLDELYHNWLQLNAFWYVAYGNCPFNGGTQPFVQRNLLRNIITEADSCIALQRPGATLRFGHETIVLPLVCLLGLNGFDQQVDNLEYLEARGWINYRVFPMAANLQIVFYRKNPTDKDVLVKVLLNEMEAELPLPTDSAPYYHWDDFKAYYLEKLASYKE